MTKKERVKETETRLTLRYPDAICELHYQKPYELLIATRLSAQCTDVRVNKVTAVLFSRYPTLNELAAAKLEDVESIIRTCGLFHTKARDILATCEILQNQYAGQLPDTMEELTALPGVGRKTANLVLGDVFHKPAVVCDTHFIRICGRLGFTDSTNPLTVENEMRKLLNPTTSSDFCHRIVLFGRDICTARSPACENCPLSDICPSRGKVTSPSGKGRPKKRKGASS